MIDTELIHISFPFLDGAPEMARALAGGLDWELAGGVTAVAAVASAVLTGVVLSLLLRWGVMDHPNGRSSHARPTPRGGGWGIVLTTFPLWLVIAAQRDAVAPLLPILVGVVGLAGLSWCDDRGGLGAFPRFLMQIIAVGLGLLALPDGAIFQGLLPHWADRLVAALAWLWFVNLFNFMDGIDGIAGVETACVGVAVALIVALTGGDGTLALYGLSLAGAAIGFLVWNWHPARVFMGDVGSVPVGFVLGFLILSLAASGQWVAALLAPAYFLADATITLLRRAFRLERVWRAHREHFYQRGVQRGFSHARVSGLVLMLNLLLMGLAALSTLAAGWVILPTGLMLVAVWLALIGRGRA